MTNFINKIKNYFASEQFGVTDLYLSYALGGAVVAVVIFFAIL